LLLVFADDYSTLLAAYFRNSHVFLYTSYCGSNTLPLRRKAICCDYTLLILLFDSAL